ncbi:MAG: hypothetical protein JXK07_03000 [Spirochaetes bacterium]|nr:hypothetical protein [Spirochaetota bacterium]MBN2771054.1 hypothetical protein [Spirochaetota bacterium]
MKLKMIIFLNLFFLLSCIHTPCRWILSVHSEEDAYLKISDGERQTDFNLKSGDSIERNISDYRSGTVIIIKTANFSRAYRIGEYDHWFAKTHKIRVIITSNGVDFDSGGLGMQQCNDKVD